MEFDLVLIPAFGLDKALSPVCFVFIPGLTLEDFSCWVVAPGTASEEHCDIDPVFCPVWIGICVFMGPF